MSYCPKGLIHRHNSATQFHPDQTLTLPPSLPKKDTLHTTTVPSQPQAPLLPIRLPAHIEHRSRHRDLHLHRQSVFRGPTQQVPVLSVSRATQLGWRADVEDHDGLPADPRWDVVVARRLGRVAVAREEAPALFGAVGRLDRLVGEADALASLGLGLGLGHGGEKKRGGVGGQRTLW